jgi:hypothetical protein
MIKLMEVTMVNINFAIFLEINDFYYRKSSTKIQLVSSFMSLITLVILVNYVIRVFFSIRSIQNTEKKEKRI